MRKSYLIATGVFVAAGLWVATGMMGRPDEKQAPALKSADSVDAAGTAEKMRVSVRTIRPQPVIDEVTVSGRTGAARRVEIKAEIDGRVTETPVAKGAAVKAGDVLVRIDVRDRQAKRSEAEYSVNEKEIAYKTAQGLSGEGFGSKVRVEAAHAELEAARARLKSADVELANTRIKAPFDGVLEERPAELGQYLTPGSVAGTLIDLDPIKVAGFVSERQVGRIKAGAEAVVTLPDGSEHKGSVSFIASTAEEQTRTFKVEVEVPNSEGGIVEGLTAHIRLPLAEQQAYGVPPSVLTLDDQGRIGVKTINNEGKVAFIPVSVIVSKENTVWVGGLSGDARVIVTGQDFVAEGARVDAVEEGGGGP